MSKKKTDKYNRLNLLATATPMLIIKKAKRVKNILDKKTIIAG